MRTAIIITAFLFLSFPSFAAEERIVTITCYQNGQEIIREENLKNYNNSQGMIYGQRQNGTWVTISGIGNSSGTVCKIEDHKNQRD